MLEIKIHKDNSGLWKVAFALLGLLAAFLLALVLIAFH